MAILYGVEMEQTQITELQAEPFFDLEDFLNFSHETRLDGHILENLTTIWQKWLPLLKIQKLQDTQDTWLALWLPHEVEIEIDEAWRESANKGFMLNNLAQYMCMTAVQDLLPQAANGGCAPSPSRCSRLTTALINAGLPCNEKTGAPQCRYAVITYYPFKGGCEICSLQSACPKGNGANEFASIVLPGFERGK